MGDFHDLIFQHLGAIWGRIQVRDIRVPMADSCTPCVGPGWGRADRKNDLYVNANRYRFPLCITMGCAGLRDSRRSSIVSMGYVPYLLNSGDHRTPVTVCSWAYRIRVILGATREVSSSTDLLRSYNGVIYSSGRGLLSRASTLAVRMRNHRSKQVLR